MTISSTDIERMARQIIGIIREIQESDELPADISYFGQLHDHMDANVGWSDEIDALPTDDWAAVQNRVNELLRDNVMPVTVTITLDVNANEWAGRHTGVATAVKLDAATQTRIYREVRAHVENVIRDLYEDQGWIAASKV